MSDKLYWTVLVSIFAVGFIAGKVDVYLDDSSLLDNSIKTAATGVG
jgi:hypothetical protein